MSRATRDLLWTVAYMTLGGLIAIAVLAPQVVTGRRRVDELERNERTIAHRCTIRIDGSAVCPPAVFHVDEVAR